MAKSKYEYVRQFEQSTNHHLLLDSYIVVRVDGQCFHRFAKEHNFLKPNDKRSYESIRITRDEIILSKHYHRIWTK
ncbi:hypothetical protein BLA29_008406 [Euroglyphus maynei]|uniref:Probable tRNA(His) guanylyltransferase n=1 Tax=Euroglyphus maynei TaxID=6958 RepID=A0A1Y3AX14_EURMA|nr:hypothetical protein BLA29_008406 [Euroglyphus maynei]